jgi:hypothetical protein
LQEYIGKFQDARKVHASGSDQAFNYPLIMDLTSHLSSTMFSQSRIMAAEIVAFVLLLHWPERKWLRKQEIAEDFQRIREKVKRSKRDVGFSGESIDAAEYGVSRYSRILNGETAAFKQIF